MRLFRAHASEELGKITSGSAMQGLWLGDRKVGFQVIGDNRSRSLGKLGEEEGEEEEPATEQRREYTDLGLDLGKREEQVVSHASALALAMTDEAHQEADM